MRPSLWKTLWRKRITRRSKINFAMTVLLALGLLCLSFVACVSGPQRIERPTEGWKIDPDDVTLYRSVPNGKEDWMPIRDNPDMWEFICFEGPSTKEIIRRTEK